MSPEGKTNFPFGVAFNEKGSEYFHVRIAFFAFSPFHLRMHAIFTLALKYMS